MTTSLWTQMSSLFQYFFVSCLASLQSTTSLKKHSLPQLKWATCFWQMEAMANVDKWTEQPGGFYESAAAWQIYLLSHHSSLCWGWALLTFHSTIAPCPCWCLALCGCTRTCSKKVLPCNSSVFLIESSSLVFLLFPSFMLQNCDDELQLWSRLCDALGKLWIYLFSAWSNLPSLCRRVFYLIKM